MSHRNAYEFISHALYCCAEQNCAECPKLKNEENDSDTAICRQKLMTEASDLLEQVADEKTAITKLNLSDGTFAWSIENILLNSRDALEEALVTTFNHFSDLRVVSIQHISEAEMEEYKAIKIQDMKKAQDAEDDKNSDIEM